MDARLVPAALVAWLSGFVAVLLPARLTLGTASTLVALSIVPATVLWRERRRGRRAHGVRGRHRAARSAPPAAAVLLTMLCAVAVLAATAGHVHARSGGLLPELVDQRATAVVRGTVMAEPRPVLNGPAWQTGPRYRVLLVVQEVHGRGKRAVADAPVVLVGPADWAEVALGQEIEVRGRFAPTAPGDAASAVVFTDRAPRTTAGPQGHLALVHTLRSGLRDVTAGMSPQAQGLVPGIAVGDDRALPEDLRDAMRATSLTHLTAVSGAHVAILLGCTLLLLVWLPRWARTVLGALVLTAFVTLVRPEPSVLRSAVMGAVVLAALALGRPARALPALCAAVITLVLADPWLAHSYGFVLSVLATAGLVLLARPWTRWLSHVLPRWAAALVAVPAAAQALCGPVVVLLTPAVATYAVPANVLAAPAVPPATVLGVAATLLAPWWPTAAGLLAGGAGACTWWIAGVARFFAALPAAQLPWPGGVTGVLALAGATALGVLVLHRSRQPTRGSAWRDSRWVALPVLLTVLIVVLLLLLPGPARMLGAWLPGGWPPRDWLAVQCDVGQGSATVLRSGPRTAVMTDVGPVDGGAAACLAALGVERLDLLVLTHAHADHVGGLPEVLDEVTVTRALLTPGSEPAATTRAVLTELAGAGVPVDRPTAGASGTSGAVRWRVLWPTTAAVEAFHGPAAVNDLSVAVHLSTAELDVVALGDLEVDGQAGLRHRLRAEPVEGTDVVVMAHHGSARQDAALAAAVGGRLVLVAVGEDNDYGHPAPSALALYGRGGALVRRTDTCGAVAVVPGPAVVAAREGSAAGTCATERQR